MSKIISVIPARSGSKGVQNKNIRKIAGYPMLEWAVSASLRSAYIDRTLVSTDSEVYAKVARECGAEVPFLRPAEISRDNSSDYEVIKHVLDWLEEYKNLPEYIAYIRPTSPLRDPNIIGDAIKAFIHAPDATSLRSVHPMSESAYKTFEIDDSGVMKQVGASDTNIDAANRPRQEFPTTYVANGYIDVLSVKFIRSTGLIHGSRAKPFITPIIEEVDTEQDLKLLEHRCSLDPSIISMLFGE